MTNAKKEIAAFHLIKGDSKTETARKVGVTRQTVTIWCKQPEFKALLRQKRREHWDKMYDKAIANVSPAIEVLTKIMKDKDGDPNTRIRAAKEILHYGIGSLDLRKIRDHTQQVHDEMDVKREESEIARKKGQTHYIYDPSLYRP